MDLDWIHPRVLKELMDVLTKLYFISTGGLSWMEVHKRDANLQEGLDGRSGKLQAVSLTSKLGKVMGQIILRMMTWCIQETQVIRPSQHWFAKVRPCLTNLISFYDRVTHLKDVGKAVHVVCSKVFDTISHSILLEKVVSHRMDGCSLYWVENWLDGQAPLVAGHK